MVVVGLIGLVTSARDDDSLVTGTSTTAPGQSPTIWPLTYDVPVELLATPDSAARAYLSQVAQLPADVPLGVTITDGTSATVDYVMQDIPARESVRGQAVSPP